MTINVFEENGTAVVAPVGKIDHVTVEEFESKISEAGESHDALTLDMAGVEYVSSAALRAILNANDIMESKGGMTLKNVNNKVMEILNITGFADIAREGLRYVNRQKGSGTRILTDYLVKQNGLDTDSIYGYDREELTHTSVAAQIVNGSADAGMGIYSAAKLYDLDFIPICIEEYDLIIPDHAWNTPMVQQMLATLRSESFREKILSMGGYTIDNPGEIIEF